MAGCLCVLEKPSDAAALSSFALAGGWTYDFVCLSGAPEFAFGCREAFVADWDQIPPADAVCGALVPIAGNYDLVAGISNMFGKDVLPRLAGMLDIPMVSDITKCFSSTEFERPMFAGNVLARVRVESGRFVASIRPTAFAAADPGAKLETKTVPMRFQTATARVSASAKAGGRPDLALADVVVTGGRPLKDAATFEKLIGGLADALGGAVGATRAAVDSGIAPNELQVGQTGKIVAPSLYIAAGVSGSTQHIAGMKDSKTIVAINTDPDAPIFEIADYGLVQDLFSAIPEIVSKLNR